MIVYKLTDQQMRTYGGCQWALNETKRTDGSGELCGPGWLHYYYDPLLAVMLNPIHANINNPLLFEAKAAGKHLNDYGLKGGCTRLTLTRELPLPVVTLTQRVAFGILCAKSVYADPVLSRWADNWLSGADRSKAAARAAVWAAEAAAEIDLISLAQKAMEY